jgi:sugar transferase EpsL
MGWRAAPGREMIRTVGVARGGQQGGRRGTTTSNIASRVFDVVVAGLVLLVVWPVPAAVASAIRRTMSSLVLCRQQRVGQHGATFQLLKFRTTRTSEPGDDGPDVDEARPTEFRRMLRATGLGLLPTLVNVLRGETGPVRAPTAIDPLPDALLGRPCPPPRGAAGHHREGPCPRAQRPDWDDQLDMDLWYVDNRSVGIDVRNIAATVRSVVRREGINHEGRVSRLEFPGSGVDLAEAAP